jgi:hypothetical protein
MVDEAEFSQALEKIYAATLSESFWPDALRTVGRMFDSDFTHFEVLEKKTGIPVFFRIEGASEDALMQRLTPHLSQAMKIHMRLALQQAEH